MSSVDGSGRLLDVGCGPGSLTLLLAPHFAQAFGIDPDAGMLSEAAPGRTGRVDRGHTRGRGHDLPRGRPYRPAATGGPGADRQSHCLPTASSNSMLIYANYSPARSRWVTARTIRCLGDRNRVFVRPPLLVRCGSAGSARFSRDALARPRHASELDGRHRDEDRDRHRPNEAVHVAPPSSPSRGLSPERPLPQGRGCLQWEQKTWSSNLRAEPG